MWQVVQAKRAFEATCSVDPHRRQASVPFTASADECQLILDGTRTAFQCKWPGCLRLFSRHDNLAQHVRSLSSLTSGLCVLTTRSNRSFECIARSAKAMPPSPSSSRLASATAHERGSSLDTLKDPIVQLFSISPLSIFDTSCTTTSTVQLSWIPTLTTNAVFPSLVHYPPGSRTIPDSYTWPSPFKDFVASLSPS